MYHGSSDSLHEPFNQRLDNPDNQVSGQFGISVAWLDEGGREDRLGRVVAGVLRRLLG